MMGKFFILGILALILEFYLYKRLSASSKASKSSKLIYITQAAIINITTIVVMLMYHKLIADIRFMGIIAWVILMFLTSFATKFLFAIPLVIKQLLRLKYKNRKFKGLLYLSYSLSAIIFSVIVYGTWCATVLRIERIEIHNEKIPAEFDGFKIALFSDVHLGNFSGREGLIRELVDSINIISPDIVAQGGDFVNIHSGEITEEYIEIFSKIKPPVYSVLGNHDLAYYISDTMGIRPSQSLIDFKIKHDKIGWNLLENEGKWLYKGQDSIYLAGVSFANNIRHNGYNSRAGGSDMSKALREVSENDYSILIAHTPEQYDSIGRVLPDLTLSGHTHTMQFKLSLGDWQWSPAIFKYKRYSGLYNDLKNRDLYINDGFGYVIYPFRFGAKPELTILTLRSVKQT